MLALRQCPPATPRFDETRALPRGPSGLTWLDALPLQTQVDFAQRLHWISLVDHVAWEGLLEGEALDRHQLLPRHPADLGVSWCEAWQQYLTAAAQYHRPFTAALTLEAHCEQLLDLGGSAFCIMPGVDWSLRRSMAHFGALHLFFESLWALSHDVERGRCSFPAALVENGFSAATLDRYLAILRQEARELIELPGLPTALALMRQVCLKRHELIERHLRAADFDFERAHRSYAAELAAPKRVSRRRPAELHVVR